LNQETRFIIVTPNVIVLIAIMLYVVMPNIIVLGDAMLYIIMPNVVKPDVVMTNVMAPYSHRYIPLLQLLFNNCVHLCRIDEGFEEK
jgi:hypothetical protein